MSFLRKGHFYLLPVIPIITAGDRWKPEKNTSEDKFSCYQKNRGNEQNAHYAPEDSRFFRFYDYGIALVLRRSFFTRILKVDEQRFLYIDPFIRVKFLELVRDNEKPGKNGLKRVWEGVHICKIFKPAACSFMKKLAQLQKFKRFSLLCRRHILRNTLECLHMILVSFFFSATILQYKQLKTSKFTFLIDFLMKSKESKVLYYRQAVFSLTQFYFLHFLQCVVMPHFHNNERTIISGLTRGGTDVSDICSFRKRIHGDYKVQERNRIDSTSSIFST